MSDHGGRREGTTGAAAIGRESPRWGRALCGALASLAVWWVAPAAGQLSAPLSTAGPPLQELGRKAQDTSLPEAERLDMVRVLAQWGTAQVRDPLVVLLQDPVPAIRELAARGLGWEGNREASAALRARVEAAGETTAVRAAALDSLGKIGDDSARDTVLAASNDPDPAVRGVALTALTTGSLAHPSDRVELLRRLAGDRALDLWARSNAIRELGVARDTASSQLLMGLLEHEPPIPMPLAKDRPDQQEVMIVRYRQARDVRAWAALALGLMEAREALPLLLRSAEDPDDFFLRTTSMGSLVAWKAPEAVPVFVRRLEDPFADVRALALGGLAQAGDRSAADAVLARLADQVPAVRIQAVDALVALGHPRARAELENLRRAELDSQVQQAITAALARLGPS